MFRIVGRGAHQVDDFDQLLDYARTRNSEFAQPLLDEAARTWIGVSYALLRSFRDQTLGS